VPESSRECVAATSSPLYQSSELQRPNSSGPGSVGSMDWLDTYSDPSVKAASVVTNLWIAAFAITSALFALLGECAAAATCTRNVSLRLVTMRMLHAKGYYTQSALMVLESYSTRLYGWFACQA